MPIAWAGRDAGILPQLKAAVDQVFASLPDNYVVVQGARTPAQQAALYAQGRNAQGQVINASQIVTDTTNSPHEYGAAVDFAPLNPDGSINWDPNSPALNNAIGAVRANPMLTSGADFVLAGGARDLDHIELKNWKLYAQPVGADATSVAAATAATTAQSLPAVTISSDGGDGSTDPSSYSPDDIGAPALEPLDLGSLSWDSSTVIAGIAAIAVTLAIVAALSSSHQAPTLAPARG